MGTIQNRPIRRVGPVDGTAVAPLQEHTDERFTKLVVDHSIDPDVLNAIDYKGYVCKQDSKWMFWTADGLIGRFSSLRSLFEAVDKDIKDKAA